MTRKWPRNTRSNWCCREILVGKLCLHPSSCHNQMHVATIMLQQMSNICCLDVQLALRCIPFYCCWGLCFVHKEFLYSSSVVFILYRSSFLWHAACWCKCVSLGVAITTLRYLCWETQLALFITRCRYSDFWLSHHILNCYGWSSHILGCLQPSFRAESVFPHISQQEYSLQTLSMLPPTNPFFGCSLSILSVNW